MNNKYDEKSWEHLLGQIAPEEDPSDDHRRKLRDEVLSAYDQGAYDRGPIPQSQISFASKIILSGRHTMRRPLPRIAASIAILVLVGFFALQIVKQQSSPAFADMVKPMMQATSATFNMKIALKKNKVQSLKALLLEPGRFRQEMPEGQVIITDFNKKKMVSLMPKRKLAMVVNISNMPEAEAPLNFFQQLKDSINEARTNPDIKLQELGKKKIGKQNAIGYRLTAPACSSTMWFDLDTNLPITIEQEIDMIPGGIITMSDFVFNLQLDESLFSLVPPEGYTVREVKIDASLPTEDDLIAMFKQYSDLSDGSFPEAFDMSVLTVVGKKIGIKKDEIPTQEQTDKLFKFTRGLQFTMTLSFQADAHYAGKGVKRDTPDKPIFWYRPKGKQTYRVVYADLSVRDADNPPNVPDAQSVPKKKPQEEQESRDPQSEK